MLAEVRRPCSVSTSTRQQVALPRMPFSSTVSAASFMTAEQSKEMFVAGWKLAR